MEQDEKSCSVLMFGVDVEWIHAYTKILGEHFVVRDWSAEMFWQLKETLTNETVHLVVVAPNDELPAAAEFEKVLTTEHGRIPLMAINPNREEGLDSLIAIPADYVVPRADVHTAVKYTQTVMCRRREEQNHQKLRDEYKALSYLYETLYRDLPDPVCYAQDGLFMAANQAFFDALGYEDMDALSEITLMNLVTPRSERELKALLRSVLQKGILVSEQLQVQRKDGEKVDYICSASKVIFHGEPAVQLHFRTLEQSAGVGGGGVDETTGLAGVSMFSTVLENQREKDSANMGYFIYLWVENYREVWQKDGYQAAEILMGAVAKAVERYMPSSTVAARFCDDALLLWAQGSHEQTLTRITTLLEQLDQLVPENIGRLIHPHAYAGLEQIKAESELKELLSKGFRGVKALAVSQSPDRIAQGAGEVSRKDERRVAILQKILEENRLSVRYQPISALEPDGVPRFAARFVLEPAQNADDEDMEFDALMTLAERYGYNEQLDKLRINTLLQDILSYDGNQKALNIHVPISGQSLSDEKFSAWVLNQLKQTGIAPAQITLEVSTDTANNAFTGTERTMEIMRKAGSHFSLTEIGRFDDEIKELLTRLNPDVIKLDMREIDTFEDEEEERFMTQVKEYTAAHKIMIIVDHMESPAQLSRVWPYDLQYLQGDGLLPPIRGFDYDFSEPLF